MRLKTLILSLVAFVVAASFLPMKGFASSFDQEPVVFDMVTFKELDQKAQSIWESLVRQKGSEQAALQAIYLKNAKPDPRLQELHFEVTQLLDSSAFSKEEIANLRYKMSGLMRFVLNNISLHYGKYIPGNTKYLKGSWFRPQLDKMSAQKMLIDCAATPSSPQVADLCVESFGLALNLLARKAGRAALFSMVSEGRSDKEIARALQKEDDFARYEARKPQEKNRDAKLVCSSILNKTAQDQIILLHQDWFGWGFYFDSHENNFKDFADICKSGMSWDSQAFESSLIPNQYNSVWHTADAYFPNDDVK